MAIGTRDKITLSKSQSCQFHCVDQMIFINVTVCLKLISNKNRIW